MKHHDFFSSYPVIRFTVIAVLLCVLGMVASVAQAQTSTRVTPCDAATPNNAICVSGAAVTTGTNGETLTGVTYRVEQKAGTGAYATVATGLTTLQYYAKNLSPGTYTFRAYANCATPGCVESAPSNEASKGATAIPVQPNTPVIIIAAVIRADGPPTYRIIQSVTLKPNEVVFAAPASMRSLFAAR